MPGLRCAVGATGALKRLNDELHLLHARAGWPSVRIMAKACGCGPNIVQRVFSTPVVPKLPILLDVVEYLAKECRKVDPDAECDRFDALWQAALAKDVPDFFPDSTTDGDDEDGCGPSAPGVRPTPTGPVGPAGGCVTEPPIDGSAAPLADESDVTEPVSDSLDPATSRALFVGIAGYSTPETAPVPARSLLYTQHIAGLFKNSGDGTLGENTELLLNATRERIWSAFVDAASQAQDTLVIYFSGHGIRDDRTSEVYLAAADTTTTDDGFTVNAISVRDIRYLLSLSPVKNLVVIVDACFSDSHSIEQRTTVLPSRPYPAEPYNVRAASLRRNTFVLANGSTEGPELDAFPSSLLHVMTTGAGKTMSYIHERLVQLSRLQHWRGPRRAYVNDGDRIRLDGMLHRRRQATLSVWQIVDGQVTVAPGVLLDEPVTAATAIVRRDHALSIAAIGDDRAVRVWELRNGKFEPSNDAGWGQPARHVDVVSLAAAPDGRTLLVAATSHGTIEVWDSSDGGLVATPLLDTASVTAVAAAALPDGRTVIAAVGADETVRLWDFRGRTRPQLVWHDSDHRIRSIAFVTTLDGEASLITGDVHGAVNVWDIDTGHVSTALETGQQAPIDAVAAVMPADGRMVVATADDSGAVQLWDLATGTPIGDSIRHAVGGVVLAGVMEADGVRFVLCTP